MADRTNASIRVRGDLAFALACAVVYAAVVLATPPYIALEEPDTLSYLTFEPMRTMFYPIFLRWWMTLGLDFIRITWIQLAIFSGALVYFLLVLLRSGFPRLLLAILVMAMAGNVLFSSFHRSILSESLYFSLTLIVVAMWIDYLRTGRLPRLLWAGLALGMMTGLRLAGLSLLPFHVLTIWLKRPNHVSPWVAVVLALLPVGLTVGVERALYYVVHRNFETSQTANLLMGKAAMLVRPDMTFTGPHAQTLQAFAAELYTIYEPARRALAASPSLGVRAQLAANYEGQAQFSILARELTAAAEREHTSVATLRSELGKQVIAQNLSGYLALVALHDFGQWSVAAQNFPPIARALAAYADANPAVSFDGRLPRDLLHPRPTAVGLVVYPAFLAAGAVTLVLAVGFLYFLARPASAASPIGYYMLLATFFSAMCHGYTLFIAIVNIWTPRFLMAVFPQIEIIALCLILVAWRLLRKGTVADATPLRTA